MNFKLLEKQIEGELLLDETSRRLYATDASAYRELPLAVVIPRNESDIVKLVAFAIAEKTSIIPRMAGTSLAGQVVGGGIVMDMSRHFGDILEINEKEAYAWIQPGIIRDDLNRALKPYGYFFAPETSTANRAMIGGMIGNNSCGSNSIVYGSTREHLLEVHTILADGTKAWFGALDSDAFIARCNGHQTSGELHNMVYFQIKEILQDKHNQQAIEEGYPKRDIPRRNTGYALDMLLRQQPFSPEGNPFNFCELIAGSEGTLAIVTAAKIKLTPLPPTPKRLICIHCNSIDESLRANLTALAFNPSACELMDHYILEATKRNTMYLPYRWFVEGDPQALLVVEIVRESEAEVIKDTAEFIEKLKQRGQGFAYPVISGDDMQKVWGLRKAGLGLLSNIPGDAKPVPVIEDTAVDVNILPEYIAEFNDILNKHGLYSVHYAHAGSGELHLRPILDLKTSEGIRMFRVIATEIAALVKKYKGSLSGEHGDGRLRGEFIPFMLGEHNYNLCKEVKKTWDPHGIFNPGKIVDTQPMDTSLRFAPDQKTPEFETVFDFSDAQGIVRAAEQCNGSGDCRKTALSGGTMCPSYMATRAEKDTTRARANILREMLTKSDREKPFASKEIKEVMDLCLSCKGCKSECPSNVDIAKLKAEWQHQYYHEKGVPIRSWLIGNFKLTMQLASVVPWLYNFVFSLKFPGNFLKRLIGFAPRRSMPKVYSTTLTHWFKKEFKSKTDIKNEVVYLFIDEFTDYNDVPVGKKAVLLLDQLGFEVKVVRHKQSGRSFLSKGLLTQARKLAAFNVNLFSSILKEGDALIGIEPSAILTFRDEYISLLRGEEQRKAIQLAQQTFTIEEFLANAFDSKKISSEQFTNEPRQLKIHGHCHQKALSSLTPTKKILSIPANYRPQMIPSGCCGMAGSFGYEKEHFDVSMNIGELVLFPAVRNLGNEVTVAAAGTSCRHQIKDGTGKKAKHPVEILFEALI